MKKWLIYLALPLCLFSKNIEVYGSAYCGCCKKWVKYIKNNGYKVNLHESNEFYKIKEQMKIKPEYQSCHTGIIEGYAIEGHVPVSAIEWLLENKPDIIGLSVHGMPQGSPGMQQGIEEEYPVILLLKDGTNRLYGYFKGDKLISKAP